MPNDDLEQKIHEAVARVFAEAQRPPDPITTVATAAEFQAALDAGGTIAIAAAATLEAPTFRVSKAGTTILGQGARVVGTSGPALHVLPGVHEVTVRDLVGGAAYQTVFQIGNNDDAQTALEQVPRLITFERLSVPTHRGKRAFEINGAEVQLLDCEARDTWDPARRDSQAIAVLNTPGPVLVRGGYFEGGSENIIVGGDTMKLADVVPSDLTFEDLTLRKPLAWKTDGVVRMVKNIFELKTGERVRVRRVLMDGCWDGFGQAAYAVVITPRSGGFIRDVEFDAITVINSGAGVNILGVNNKPPATLHRTTGIVFRNSRFEISKRTFGGHGYLALLSGGPGTVAFEHVVAVSDNSYGVGISVADLQPIEALRVVGSYLRVPFYNRAASYLNSSQPETLATQFVRREISGNVVAEASARFKAEFPDNQFVTVAEFDALVPGR